MPGRNGNRPERLRLLDYSDRALLAIVYDLGDNEGWVEVEWVADRIFGVRLSDKKRLHAIRCVAQRFSWMRRYGVMDKSDGPMTMWCLTAEGEAYVKGRKKDSVAGAMHGLLENDLLHAAHAIGERYSKASPIGKTMMRRAFAYHTAKRV